MSDRSPSPPERPGRADPGLPVAVGVGAPPAAPMGVPEGVARVTELVRARRDVTGALAHELQALRGAGQALEALEEADRSKGVLAAVTRVIGRRGRGAERDSAARRLQDQHQQALIAVRRAGAFADELAACARGLQAEVDRLHDEADRARAARAAAEGDARALEAEVQALDALPDLGPHARRVDQLQVQLRLALSAVQLQATEEALAVDALAPVRALREQVLTLHEDVAGYVHAAGRAVRAAGVRATAVALAADAPLVLADLHGALDQLGEAVAAGQACVNQVQDLLHRVLPELTAELQARALAGPPPPALPAETGDLALRHAAVEEVEALLRAGRP